MPKTATILIGGIIASLISVAPNWGLPFGGAFQAGSCREYTVTNPPTAGDPTPEPSLRAKGRPLSRSEQDHVDRAIEIIAEWEAKCPGQLPEVPSVGSDPLILEATEPVSVAVQSLDFCVEIVPGQMKDTEAAAFPPSGTYTGPSGTTQEITGDNNTVHLEEGKLHARMTTNVGELGEYFTAGAIIHELAHLRPTPSNIFDECAKEIPAYEFQIQYFCALLACLEFDTGVEAETLKTFACHKINSARDALCDKGCPPATTPCASCPPNTNIPPWSGGIAPTFPREGADVIFSTGPLSSVSGRIDVMPAQNQVSIAYTDGLLSLGAIFDLNVEIPGFQVTCFDLPQSSPLGQFALGGYDTGTNEGMIVRAVLDLSGTPTISLTEEYQGTGFGAPHAIFGMATFPNRVLVLDSVASAIVSCNIVTDTCVTLESATTTPALTSTRDLNIFFSAPGATNPFVEYIATSGNGQRLHHTLDTETVNTEVVLTDFGGDLTIEAIRVR